MAKFNTLSPARPKGGPAEEAAKQGNNLFNLKSFNELKKDQTNIKIFKNPSFDSNFNAFADSPAFRQGVILQSLDTNLSNSSLLLNSSPLSSHPAPACRQGGGGSSSRVATKNIKAASLSLQRAKSGVLRTKREGSYPKISAILRAIRSIRLNRDEWKLIKYINLSFAQSLPLAAVGRQRKGSKLRSKPLFGCPSLPPRTAKRQGILSPPVAPQNKKKGALAAYGRGPAGGAVLRKVGAITAPSSTIAPSSNNIYCPSPSATKRQGRRHNSLLIKQKSYNKIYTYNNIISKNILLRNMKYNFLKSTLSSILIKKIRRISEVLEDKPIKNYVLYSYLKNCIFTPPHIATTPLLKAGEYSNITAATPCLKAGRGVPAPMNGREAVPLPLPLPVPGAGHSAGGAGRSKLSLNKYKGRKFGSFINYNKIIGFKFNSTFYQAYPNCPASSLLGVSRFGCLRQGVSFARAVQSPPFHSLPPLGKAGASQSCNRYIKDTYKLLFYLFKSMYCLISKPVLNYTNDKVTIQLFYYLNIPKKKIFRLFSISYIKSIKKKWLAQSTTALRSTSLFSKGESYCYAGRGNTKLKIRWKIRKAISRLKNKIITSPPSAFRQVATQGREAGKNLLFLLRKFNLSKVYQNKFKLICAILSKKFNKPVELQLIRLHHPYHDSNILVNLLSLNIKNKRKKARVAIQKIYNKKPVKNLNDPNLKTSSPASPAYRQGQGGKVPLIPAFLSGLNIKIAGRLMGEPIIPRITTKVFGKGASATGKVNYLDVARITKKNRKGAYTIKITSGQNFF